MREILIGNCRDKLRELPAESVQCVITSPPYWGLRRYEGEQSAVWGGDPDCEHEWESRRYYVEQSVSANSREAFSEAGEENIERLKAARWREDSTCTKCGAWYGAFGLEPTPELYVANTVEILREIRRVLRPDGVIWWNLGDSYAGSGQGWQHKDGGSIQRKWLESYGTGRPPGYISSATASGLKPKDLTLIPARVALAAQADGFWVRAMVIWEKPNTMPESVKDRPTESHEYILLLTKSERYFYDADAVREPHKQASLERVQQKWADATKYDEDGAPDRQHSWQREREEMTHACHPGGRNLRSVWRFATIPYMGAHFAVFPPELPRRCILAGSPPKVCAECGAPYERMTEREPVPYPGGSHGNYVQKGRPPGGNYAIKGRPPGGQENADSSTLGKVEYYRVVTVGWQPTCECHADLPADQRPTRPAIILDPFAGSGTTLKVAEDLGRWWVGIDICEQYSEQIRERTAQRSLTAAFENETA
jgi:DNA modification methylase